jgi:hypothetical protein
MITITIKTDNAAFEEGPYEGPYYGAYEVARILQDLANRWRDGRVQPKLYDVNGNVCGRVMCTGKDR